MIPGLVSGDVTTNLGPKKKGGPQPAPKRM